MRPINTKYKAGISVLGAMLSLTLHAQSAWRPVVTLGAGVSFVNAQDNSQEFPILNPVTDEFYTYSANNSTQSMLLLDVLLGVERNLSNHWIIQTGIDFDIAPTPYTLNGGFIQGADLQSAESYTYQYKVETRQLLINGKLLYTVHKTFHPYVLGAAGVSFNNSTNYQTSVSPTLTFTRMYGNNHRTSFSYVAGLGIDKDITHNLRIGIGYRYTDFGKTRLGNAAIDTTPVTGTLSNAHIHANQLLAQITWVFNQ